MIIGIAGKMNSGKDTVASILNYIYKVGKHKAKYSEWIIKRKVFEMPNFNNKISFASILKENLSKIFNLPLDKFEDRDYKDTFWFNPYTGKFILTETEADKYVKIDLNNINELDITCPQHIIKLRTIIQSYAEKIKDIFGDSIWINSTIAQALSIEYANKYCIIPDVRFNEEVRAIWRSDGIVIKIDRPNNPIKCNHVSEEIDIWYNYKITNDGNLQQLFYQVLNIYNQIN